MRGGRRVFASGLPPIPNGSASGMNNAADRERFGSDSGPSAVARGDVKWQKAVTGLVGAPGDVKEQP